jgi:hypothetical protein
MMWEDADLDLNWGLYLTSKLTLIFFQCINSECLELFILLLLACLQGGTYLDLGIHFPLPYIW